MRGRDRQHLRKPRVAEMKVFITNGFNAIGYAATKYFLTENFEVVIFGGKKSETIDHGNLFVYEELNEKIFLLEKPDAIIRNHQYPIIVYLTKDQLSGNFNTFNVAGELSLEEMKNEKSMIHPKDIARALYLFITNPRNGEVYDLSGDLDRCWKFKRDYPEWNLKYNHWAIMDDFK